MEDLTQHGYYIDCRCWRSYVYSYCLSLKSQLDSAKTTEKKLEACEVSHQESQKNYMALAVQLAELKGKQEGISELAEQVLKTVKDVSQKGG